MQTKSSGNCNYNFNISRGSVGILSSIKRTILFLLLLLIICFSIIAHFNNSLNSFNNRDISVADFKLDLNTLSETAAVIEAERMSNKYPQINYFGSDGNLMKSNELRPALKVALTNIADINKDENISNEEISMLGIMRLKPDSFQKEFNELHFNLKSADCNFKNYILITQGKYSGTILYNGSLKFIDSKNNQYFGLELFNRC